jgi:hypothetical protein
MLQSPANHVLNIVTDGGIGIWKANTCKLATDNIKTPGRAKKKVTVIIGSQWVIVAAALCGVVLALGLCALHSSVHALEPNQVGLGQSPTARPTLSTAFTRHWKPSWTPSRASPNFSVAPSGIAGRGCCEGNRLATTPAALSAFHPTASLAHRQQHPQVTMAAANGTLTPPSLPQAPTSPSAAKRKLAEPHAIAVNGASVAAHGESAKANSRSLQAVLGDILAVLKRYDTCEQLPAPTRLRHHTSSPFEKCAGLAHPHV